MNNLNRKNGKITKIKGEYGFIKSDASPEVDVYFRTEWSKESRPLQEEESVTFELRLYNGKPQAHEILLAMQSTAVKNQNKPVDNTSLKRPNVLPVNNRFIDWAYLGHLPDMLASLRKKALREPWEFRETPPNLDRPYPILYSYLLHTFGRLYKEKKIAVSSDSKYAAINTGLVDHRYEPIYALFVQNSDTRLYWKLSDFCIPAEDVAGRDLVRNFNPLPKPAHYFDDPSELLYDVRAGKPEVNWNHIVIDNVDRFPTEFIEDNRPASFSVQDTVGMAPDKLRRYHDSLREAIKTDTRAYRMFISRLKDALELSIKRVSWNFKTAIPQYYTPVEKLQLLLPLCLVKDDRVDLALAVERTYSGNYLGHTIFPLDWAYKNARLICRPDSDWLVPEDIIDTPTPDSSSQDEQTT